MIIANGYYQAFLNIKSIYNDLISVIFYNYFLIFCLINMDKTGEFNAPHMDVELKATTQLEEAMAKFNGTHANYQPSSPTKKDVEATPRFSSLTDRKLMNRSIDV